MHIRVWLSRHFNKNKNATSFSIGKSRVVFEQWDHCRSQMFKSSDFENSLDETANMTSIISFFAADRPPLPFLHSSGVRNAALIAELNDLLQLDYDAVGAYTLAVSALRDRNLRNTLIGFRQDHECHIAELVELIRARDGVPVRMPHFPTGIFKLLVQAAGSAGGMVGGFAGGDRAVLLAFVANETQAQTNTAATPMPAIIPAT